MKILLGTFILLFSSAVLARPVLPYSSDFNIQNCTFTPEGTNTFFNLTPGRKAIFAGKEDGNKLDLVISVLNETETLTLPDIGPVVTRVIQEEESENGKIVEISRNFFATCTQTGDVFYFGEDVDIFEDDGTISHEGAWRAGVNEAVPGIIMPGRFLVGSRYFQEQAPEVALDRAHNASENVTITTEAGKFEKCVRVVERTSLEPGHSSTKIYCPAVGLVFDDGLELTVAPII